MGKAERIGWVDALIVLIVGAPIALVFWFVMFEPLVDAVHHSLESPAPAQPGLDYDVPTSSASDEPLREEVGAWSCVYAPTNNYDWHDDVRCSNGVRGKRPYLLPDVTFVTNDEIMQAAKQYQEVLNDGR